MNYQTLKVPNVQHLYDRIALLEWFMRQGEHDEMDEVELANLKQMAKSFTVKHHQTALKKQLALA